MKSWTVTYELVTPESAEHGEAEDSGIVDDFESFRDALYHAGRYGFYPRYADCNIPSMVRSICDTTFDNDYTTGATESRTLHIPNHISAASRARIVRYLKNGRR